MRVHVTLALAAVSTCGCELEDVEIDGDAAEPKPIVDERAAIQQAVSPPPITGGTLLVSSKKLFVTSDPARGRVSFVDPSGPVSQRVTELPLEAGSRPGRLVEDAQGSIHVVLRGTGKVAMLDSQGSRVMSETPVCATPRGIAYDSGKDLLHVACAEGVLQSFKPGAEQVEAEIALESDLRDVIVEGERLYVSRFRSSEVLFVEAGEIARRVSPPRTRMLDLDREEMRRSAPSVAWRMIAAPKGGVLLLHQRALTDSIAADEDDRQEVEAEPVGYGGADCQEVVTSAVTQISPDGQTQSSAAIAGMVLAVDLAVDASGEKIAVVSAGLRDAEAPGAATGGDDQDAIDIALLLELGSLSVFELDDPEFFGGLSRDPEVEVSCALPRPGGSSNPGVGVAFDPDDPGRIAILQRQPALLALVPRDSFADSLAGNTSGSNPIARRFPTYELGGASIEDTGHEIFHRDSGTGIACASCHPEGEDDGHVWASEVGPRKTQNLGQPLRATAPFHWDGSLPTLSALMDKVFVGRMGGAVQSEERMRALETWVFEREFPVVPVKDTAAAQRGKQLFESEEVGCADCHNGASFSDNKSYLVGTSDIKLQVPPLRGLRLHPPFMHNGCAETLRERFDPDCGGGDSHGKVSQLDESELDDLVAYLESL